MCVCVCLCGFPRILVLLQNHMREKFKELLIISIVTTVIIIIIIITVPYY